MRRADRSGWTRRRFLAASGAGLAGVAGAGVLLATRQQSGGVTGATPSAVLSPTMPPPATSTPVPRGGIARIAASGQLDFDTYDALRTVERSVEEVLGRTHSRLVQWQSGRAEVSADLASDWEQPDPITLVLTIDAAAHWHDRPPTAGRAVTAADVAAHFSRLLDLRAAGTLSAQLTREFAHLARVSTPDEATVVLETDIPDPLLVAALASRFAPVQAPETVEAFAATWHELRPESVVGSGPFTYSGGGEFTRHHGAHRPPFLDGIVLDDPHGSGPAATARFLAKKLDTFLARDRRDAAVLSAEAPDATRELALEDSPTISTVFAGAPPWNNLNLLRALNAALNRPELIRRLHGGQAVAAGPVGPAFPHFATPEADLLARPGYRASFDSDAAEARALWDAGGGAGLGPVTIDFPSIYDPAYSASSVVTGLLNEVLGAGQFVPAVHQYTVISAKAVAHEYGSGAARLWFGWGPPFESPDPTRYLVETFRTGSPAWEPFGMTVPGLDPTLDALAVAFDIEERLSLARDADSLLLDHAGAGVFPWLVQTAERFRWPYFAAASPSPFWPAAWDATASLDLADPLASDRPA